MFKKRAEGWTDKKRNERRGGRWEEKRTRTPGSGEIVCMWGGGVLREGRNHGNCNMTNNVPMMCDVCNGKDTECLNKKGEICLGRILGH